MKAKPKPLICQDECEDDGDEEKNLIAYERNNEGTFGNLNDVAPHWDAHKTAQRTIVH